MLKDLVIKSRSYRSFDQNNVIPKDVLTDLVDTVRFCPSAMNRQPLKYRPVFDREEVEEIIAGTKWGSMVEDILPPEGRHPVAFIVICCDTSIAEDTSSARIDVGIAAQTIMLSAADMGLGGCMLGSFDGKELSRALLIPKKYEPMLVLALGVPDETVFICNVPADGSTKYFRDRAGLHFVPKRSLEEIIIE